MKTTYAAKATMYNLTNESSQPPGGHRKAETDSEGGTTPLRHLRKAKTKQTLRHLEYDVEGEGQPSATSRRSTRKAGEEGTVEESIFLDDNTSLENVIGAVPVIGPHLGVSSHVIDAQGFASLTGQTEEQRTQSQTIILEAHRVDDPPLVVAEPAKNADDDKPNHPALRPLVFICLVLVICGAVGVLVAVLASGDSPDATVSPETTLPGTLPPLVEQNSSFLIATDAEVFAISGDGSRLISFTGNVSTPVARTWFRTNANKEWIEPKGEAGSGDILLEFPPSAMALSHSGSFAVIGMDIASTAGLDQNGQVVVYNWNAEGWNPCVNLTGSSSIAYFGTSLDISDDGTILAIGVPNSDDGFDVSHVQSYKISDCSWSLLGQRLDSSSTTGEQPNDVALSADGTVLAVAFNDFISTTKVFERKDEDDGLEVTWNARPGPPIEGKRNESYNNLVALSGAGDTLAFSDHTGVIQVLQWDSARQLWEAKGSNITVPVFENDDWDSCCSEDYSVPILISKYGNFVLAADSIDRSVWGYHWNDTDWALVFQVPGSWGGGTIAKAYSRSFAMSDNGEFVAIKDPDRGVRVYN